MASPRKKKTTARAKPARAATAPAKKPARKAVAGKAPAKKAPAATAPLRKASSKKAAARKAPARKPASAAPSAEKPARTASRGASTSEKLSVYRSKRDFGRTPEPSGKAASRVAGQWKKDRNPFFVIQKHAASRLHYDFRLEVGGVLKSWAVPKGPSMDPADKRLAVEVEDHPLDYADFEGVIPQHEYGGGTVIVWDAGPYRNLKRKDGREVSMDDCHERGQIEIWLEGKKLRGGFALVHSRMGGNQKNWLLIKMKDAAAEDGGAAVTDQDRSVLSGRSLDEVARRPARVWSSR